MQFNALVWASRPIIRLLGEMRRVMPCIRLAAVGSLLIVANLEPAMAITLGDVGENIAGSGTGLSKALNVIGLLFGIGFSIFGWSGLLSESKRQQKGVGGSILMIAVGAMLLIWQYVARTIAETGFDADGANTIDFLE